MNELKNQSVRHQLSQNDNANDTDDKQTVQIPSEQNQSEEIKSLLIRIKREEEENLRLQKENNILKEELTKDNDATKRERDERRAEEEKTRDMEKEKYFVLKDELVALKSQHSKGKFKARYL